MSLVAYCDSESEDEETTTVEKVNSAHSAVNNEKNMEREVMGGERSSPPVEPMPPRRQSNFFDEDDDEPAGTGDEEEEVEQEEELDSLLEKGLSTAKLTDSTAGGSTPGPGYTPRPDMEESGDQEMEQEMKGSQHPVELPPSPVGDCDPELGRKFVEFFRRKEQGADIISMIKGRKDFKNPSLYEKLCERYGIDEKGTNFVRDVFDPNAFTADDHYDALGDYQAAQEARRKKMALATSSTPAGEQKRSRFEK